MNPGTPLKFETGRPIGRVRLLGHVITALVLLCGPGRSLLGTDPYAAALDKQFATAPTSAQPSDPHVAALEAGIREQARHIAKEPEPGPGEAANGIERFFVGGVEAVAAVVLGLASLIGLRRWNTWLDHKAATDKQARAALAEDPLMAEFLQTLHEELRHGPLIAPVPHIPPPVNSPDSDRPQEPRAAQAPPGSSNHLTLLRADLLGLSRTNDDDGRLRILRDLLEGMELIKQTSDAPHAHSAKLLASALHCLIKQLSLRVAYLTPSALRTAAAAMDLLEFLCGRAPRPDLATNPPVRLLTVDDDPISLRAVAFSLKKAFTTCDEAVDGPSALALAIQQPYDVIFLDIEMPGMDGFELCSKIRETAANRTTPVVFVTTHTDFDSRTRSALLGAQELIAKPFLAFEITVKALSLVLRAREEREAKSTANGHEPNEPKLSAADAPNTGTGAPAMPFSEQQPAAV